MPINKLTDVRVRAFKPQARATKIADGGGLYLHVAPGGGKLWRLAYRYGGKQKLVALGPYPVVSLAEARDARDGSKRLLRQGIDPSEARKRERARQTASEELTFARVAERWHAARSPKWSEGYRSRIWSRVSADLCSQFGELSVDAIDSQCVLLALRKIEARGSVEMARRVREYAQDIFRFAKSEKLIAANPAEGLHGAMQAAGAPKRRAALKARELPEFLGALEGYDGDRVTSLALRLALLTYVRTNEVRFARWEEFEGLDGNEPIWRIPAARMKMRNEHIVPLSSQAVLVLASLSSLAGKSPFVLPSATKSGVISENTMLFALYRIGYRNRATVHGFRGTASTVLNEQGFNRDWIERQLAHVEQDQVRAAYNTAQWLPERRGMMQWWADYLDRARGAAPKAIGEARVYDGVVS